MIEPGELHRYFMVREIATGRDVWILGGDTRYALTGAASNWDYRIDPAGEFFLAESCVSTHPWGRPMRLEEVEPHPDGRGLWHPDHLPSRALNLAATYDGSFRQMADREHGEPEHCGECGEPIMHIAACEPGQLARLGLTEWVHAAGSQGHEARPETVDRRPGRSPSRR